MKLSLDEYKALPNAERKLLRRQAFGWRGVAPAHTYDLDHLRALLCDENAASAVMPAKWTDQGGET